MLLLKKGQCYASKVQLLSHFPIQNFFISHCRGPSVKGKARFIFSIKMQCLLFII